jgi:predicted membrane-bound spermidine synthase
MSPKRAQDAATPTPPPPPARGLLLATVFMTGACVLVVEIAGARVVSPLYGSGLYSWSALIAVTLAALSLGYWAGGRLADRRPEPGLFHVGILLAGILVVAVPWIAGTVLRVTEPLDPRLGVLLAALLLFFPPLALLGGVTPFAIRLARPPAGEVGGISGLVFAVSTIGSLLAAVATGFVLIPSLGVRSILALTGSVLMLVAVAGLLARGRRTAGTMAAVLVVASLFAWRGGSAGEPARGFRIVERMPSFFGYLRVVETPGWRLLTVNGIGQNYVPLTPDQPISHYLSFLSSLPRLRHAPPEARRALLIGLGAGEMVGLLSKEGVDLEVVELDPRIEVLARRHFGLTLPRERIHIADGRAFVERDRGTYDYIFMDAFLGEEVPAHLYSRESFAAMRRRLAPGGLLAINYTTIPRGEDVRAVARTLQDVFAHVRGYTDGVPPTELASLVMLASDRPIELDPGADPARGSPTLFLANPAELKTGGSRVLTDDYNPISSHRLGATRVWRQLMIANIGEDWAYWADF